MPELDGDTSIARAITLDDRVEAARWLADRGWGRSPITVITEESRANPLDSVPYEQLVALREAMRTVLEAPRVTEAINVIPTPDGT